MRIVRKAIELFRVDPKAVYTLIGTGISKATDKRGEIVHFKDSENRFTASLFLYGSRPDIVQSRINQLSDVGVKDTEKDIEGLKVKARVDNGDNGIFVQVVKKYK